MNKAGNIDIPVTIAMYVNPQLKLRNSTIYPKIALEKNAMVNPKVK
jgi:hypothetical protein